MFFNLERRNYINKSMQTLVTDSGHTVSKFTDVLNEQNKFYSSLYSNKETEDNLNVHLVDIIAPSVFFSKYVFKSFLIVNMLFSMF
jgi:hypothetical protein